MAFSQGFLEEIKDRNDIEEVIGSYINLKRAGSNVVALCPFHNEKTPSFTVFPGTRSFYCFGCGTGGDVVSFIMKFKDTIYADWFIMLVTFVTTLVFAVIAGIILGLIHVKLKVPSFIASLAFMSIWNSAALLISNSPISIPKKLWGTIDWYKISIGPLGYPLVIAFLIIIGYYVILTRTSLGRGIYAIGANERAARMSGIAVDRIKITVFAVNGFCAALGAIFLMAKAKSCAPTVGDSFTLMVISAVVLGGTALIGGSGNILNTILGVFIVSIIKNGMNIVSINVYWQKVVFGVVVLIAIAINTDRSSRSFIVK